MDKKLGVTITLMTLLGNAAMYLLTGSYNIGSKMERFEAKIELVSRELIARNQMQDYRLDKLEAQPKLR